MKMFNDIFGEWTSVNPDFLLPVKMKWYALHLPLAISTQNGFYLFYRTYSFPVINLLSTLRCRIVVFKHFFPLNHQNIAGFTIWGSFTNWKTEACPQSYSRKSGSCNLTLRARSSRPRTVSIIPHHIPMLLSESCWLPYSYEMNTKEQSGRKVRQIWNAFIRSTKTESAVWYALF